MYRNGISVDFIRLEQTVFVLREIAGKIDDEREHLLEVYREIVGMGLHEAEENLIRNIGRLERDIQEIEKSADKLFRILILYRECEHANQAAIESLPFHMAWGKETRSSTVEINAPVIRNGTVLTFRSNSVQNEAWLDEIIDERR